MQATGGEEEEEEEEEEEKEKEVAAGKEGGFVDVSSSLYGTTGLHPRQVDQSRARSRFSPPCVSLSLSDAASLSIGERCTILNCNVIESAERIKS